MGHPDGTHTHGSGGSGIGMAAAVVLAAIVAASAAGPVVHAATDVIEVLAIVVAAIVGLALATGAALVAWRLRSVRQNTPRVVHQVPPATRRAAESLPAPQRSVAALPAPERSAEIHLHLHGMSAEDVAAIIRKHRSTALPPTQQ